MKEKAFHKDRMLFLSLDILFGSENVYGLAATLLQQHTVTQTDVIP